ncbi:MAG: PEP-CTERM sorting domain-containing protein, partial [Nostoc sp.]
KFLFWDEVHPTTATHKLIGKLAFSALEPVPAPESSAVLGILAFCVGAVSLRKRKYSYQLVQNKAIKMEGTHLGQVNSMEKLRWLQGLHQVLVERVRSHLQGLEQKSWLLVVGSPKVRRPCA